MFLQEHRWHQVRELLWLSNIDYCGRRNVVSVQPIDLLVIIAQYLFTTRKTVETDSIIL